MIETNGTIKSAIKNYGLLLGGITVAFSLMLFLMDMHIEQGSLQSVVNLILTVGAIVFGQLAFKKANDGFISLGQGFKIGLGICLVGSILGIVYGIFQMTILDPDTMTKVMAYSINQAIEQNPELTDEMIEAIEGSIEFFTTPSMIAVFGIASSLFLGSIISLITGLALKKNKPA
tara:strand:- start:348 stop:872 length:525 start_codon:yes stop_codon:yes gene_type:complete